MENELDTATIVARALIKRFRVAAVEVAVFQAEVATDESYNVWQAILTALRNERSG